MRSLQGFPVAGMPLKIEFAKAVSFVPFSRFVCTWYACISVDQSSIYIKVVASFIGNHVANYNCIFCLKFFWRKFALKIQTRKVKQTILHKFEHIQQQEHMGISTWFKFTSWSIVQKFSLACTLVFGWKWSFTLWTEWLYSHSSSAHCFASAYFRTYALWSIGE